MAFATVQEFSNYMQQTVANSAATLALDIATSRIRSETDQYLSLVEDDEITLRGSSGKVYLPQNPVISVESVTTRWIGESESLTQVVDVDFVRWGNELSWSSGGYVRAGASPRWGYLGHYWPEYVTVVYTHGYAVIPDDVKGCCLMLAAEHYTSPDGTGYESIEDYAWRRDDAGESPAAVALKALVKRYGCRSGYTRVGA
jgi:hypothetical protein